MRRIGPGLVCALDLLAGCGVGGEIRRLATERTVARFVDRHDGFRATDAPCPIVTGPARSEVQS